MTEVSLFIIVGLVSIVCAMAMLLTQNAVHSALFLIVVMGCIAFMFLLLNAPFLAMVQITVYAGAIMVLFLFVIMLLGAERLGGRSQQMRWLPLSALVLSVAFLVVSGIALASSGVDQQVIPGGQPLLRVAHLAPDAEAVDIYANNELIAENVAYGTASDFTEFPAGEYNVALFVAGTDQALLAETITLERGFTGTAVAYGAGDTPSVTLITDDLSSTAARSGRVTFFNAFTEVPAVSLVDFRSPFDETDTEVLLGDVEQGQLSDSVELSEETNVSEWAFVEAGNENNILFRLRNTELYGVTRDTAQLLILAPQRLFEGSTRAVAVPLVVPAIPSFGGPESVGQALFTSYMLPMQIVAVLLLAAMVGAIVLTHKPKDTPASRRRREGGRRKVSRPLTSVIASQTGHNVYAPAETDGQQKLPEPADENA